jgi:transcriptional regulator with XRE-family HTH domain
MEEKQAETTLEFCCRRLSERRISLKILAEEAGFSESWLSKLACGKCRNPGFNSIEALAEYFRLKDEQAEDCAALVKKRRAA